MRARAVVDSFATHPNLQGATLRELLNGSIDADIERQAMERAYSIVNDSVLADVDIVAYDDAHYPSPLREIPSPPPFIYVRGALPEWEKAVAVIGTTKPTAEALQATRDVISALRVDHRVAVVSGLALGVDTQAHSSALEHRIRTVAVLANGLDSVYPSANSALADRILQAGGALISENPVRTRAEPALLVARDRLQSGLSVVTFLMQSGVDGGSMHTAKFALAQGRLLVALKPEDPGSEPWSGNTLLTTPVESINWKASPKVAAFTKFVDDGRATLALRLSAANIEPFVLKGLARNFVPLRKEERQLSLLG
jgi:DNA processing protein